MIAIAAAANAPKPAAIDANITTEDLPPVDVAATGLAFAALVACWEDVGDCDSCAAAGSAWAAEEDDCLHFCAFCSSLSLTRYDFLFSGSERLRSAR